MNCTAGGLGPMPSQYDPQATTSGGGRVRRAGASAVQIYSAMVYEGPGLAVRVKRELAARLKAEGYASVADAVGAGLRA